MTDKKVDSKILKYFDTFRLLIAIGIALAITTVIIFMVSDNPVEALTTLLTGPLQSKRYFFNVLEMMVPLMFTGLSLALVFKSGNFSMITDGSFYMGAVIAVFIAIKLPIPAIIHPAFAIIIAGIVGGLIGSIPALCKVKYKANELVTSLMLNYVFFFSGLYIINKFLIDRNASNFASLKFLNTSSLGNIVSGTRLHYGFIVAILLCVALYIFLNRTKWGYEIKLVGSNIEFAKYSGINTGRTILYTSFISGALAAMGGAIEKLGMYNRFQWSMAPTYAWDGVIIATLSGNNPKFIPFAAFFLSYIRVGADIMSRKTDVQNELVAIIQGIIILLITAERFLYFMKQRKESQLALQNKLVEGGK